MFSVECSKSDFRRETVFMVVAGLFLGTLTMLNILGVSRLIDLSFSIGSLHVPFRVFVGVLPYPITFLCTDIISELYGKRRSTMLVLIGFILNIWVLFIMWLGGALPGSDVVDSSAFFGIRTMTFGATIASMVSYLIAQFVDVNIFHYLKDKTQGRHLWLRNNVSTLISQFVDTIVVIVVTYVIVGFNFSDDESTIYQLATLVFSGYLFKVVSALLDTIPFYWCVRHLKKYVDAE